MTNQDTTRIEHQMHDVQWLKSQANEEGRIPRSLVETLPEKMGLREEDTADYLRGWWLTLLGYRKKPVCMMFWNALDDDDLLLITPDDVVWDELVRIRKKRSEPLDWISYTGHSVEIRDPNDVIDEALEEIASDIFDFRISEIHEIAINDFDGVEDDKSIRSALVSYMHLYMIEHDKWFDDLVNSRIDCREELYNTIRHMVKMSKE